MFSPMQLYREAKAFYYEKVGATKEIDENSALKGVSTLDFVLGQSGFAPVRNAKECCGAIAIAMDNLDYKEENPSRAARNTILKQVLIKLLGRLAV